MLRVPATFLLFTVAFPVMAAAGDRFYFPGHVFGPPRVVYAAPVVMHQPAYFVPTTVAVQTYANYAPVVPVVPAPMLPGNPGISGVEYYGPPVPVYGPAPYSASVYGPYRSPRHFGRHGHGTRIEFERDGDIEIKYR
jgi:hypothetical protein